MPVTISAFIIGICVTDITTFFDTIYPSHGTFPVGNELIDQLYEVTEDLSTFPRWDMEMHDQIVDCVDTGVAKFLISKEGA